MPTSVPIRYTESLQTQMTEEFCSQVVEGVVKSTLDLVTRSQAVRHPTRCCRLKTMASFAMFVKSWSQVLKAMVFLPVLDFE